MRYTSHASTISVISTLHLGTYILLHSYRLSACYSGSGAGSLTQPLSRFRALLLDLIFVPLAMSAVEQQAGDQVSSRDTLFKECLAPAFADGYKDAHDWAYDKFKEYNLSPDRLDDTDFTFTFDEAVENLLLAQSAYCETPSLGELLIPRDFFWKSVFQRCLAYMAPPGAVHNDDTSPYRPFPTESLPSGSASGDDADLKAMEFEEAQEPIVDPAAPTPATEGAVAAAATAATGTANAFQAIQLPAGQVANASGLHSGISQTSSARDAVRLALIEGYAGNAEALNKVLSNLDEALANRTPVVSTVKSTTK